MDKYTNIAELKQNEREDEDYTILYRELPSKIAIMAPHGGGIEPGTIDIADNLAGCDYMFYAFIGVSSISGHFAFVDLSLIHISEPTRQESRSRMPSSA